MKIILQKYIFFTTTIFKGANTYSRLNSVFPATWQTSRKLSSIDLIGGPSDFYPVTANANKLFGVYFFVVLLEPNTFVLSFVSLSLDVFFTWGGGSFYFKYVGVYTNTRSFHWVERWAGHLKSKRKVLQRYKSSVMEPINVVDIVLDIADQVCPSYSSSSECARMEKKCELIC